MTGPLMFLAGLSVCVGWLNWPGVDAYSKFVYYGDLHLEGGASNFVPIVNAVMAFHCGRCRGYHFIGDVLLLAHFLSGENGNNLPPHLSCF